MSIATPPWLQLVVDSTAAAAADDEEDEDEDEDEGEDAPAALEPATPSAVVVEARATACQNSAGSLPADTLWCERQVSCEFGLRQVLQGCK